MRWLQKDETTVYTDEMDRILQWQYYISSYMRVEHTEGIDRSRLQKVLLERNLPSDAKDLSDDEDTRKQLLMQEGLILRVCINSLKMQYMPGTTDCFMYKPRTFNSPDERSFHEDKQVFHKEMRDERLKEKMVTNNLWMKGMSHEEVQRVKDDYQKWKEGETLSPHQPDGADNADADMRMD